MDNTRRVLEFLKNANQQCDWVSAGGYFSFTEAQHNLWNTQCSAVTAATVVAGADAAFVANEGAWTDQTAAFANQYGGYYCSLFSDNFTKLYTATRTHTFPPLLTDNLVLHFCRRIASFSKNVFTI